MDSIEYNSSYDDMMLINDNFVSIYEQLPDEYIYEEEEYYNFNISDINDDILNLFLTDLIKLKI
jgi:hypothetical protein